MSTGKHHFDDFRMKLVKSLKISSKHFLTKMPHFEIFSQIIGVGDDANLVELRVSSRMCVEVGL